MQQSERRRHSEHLAGAERYAEEMAFFLETFAAHSRHELMTVVRTHDVEEAIGAATRILAERFRTSVIGDGPDADFVTGSRKCRGKPHAETVPTAAVALDKKSL